jgi:DNA repair exonuclease SbcCD ATPase subunit
VGKTFTVEDIERAREQEKQKLYPQLSKMEEELDRLRKEREEREAREAAAEEARRKDAEEAETRRKAEMEEEMSAKDLLRQKEAEWQAQLDAERQERERAFALLQREQEFQSLQETRQAVLAREQDNIVPELLDLIQGNTAEELEQSAAVLRERSARIMESVAQAAQQTRQNMPGTRITAPASGPLDNDPDYVSSNPGDIANMSMADYAKNRQKLLGSASNNRGQGLFG